jgi:autotransporter-associated beta strand protein
MGNWPDAEIGAGLAPIATGKKQVRMQVAQRAAWWTVGALLALASLAGAQTVWLEAAENTTLLGGSTITNTGATSVFGNISLSPGVSVTGFPPGTITGGAIHINDDLAVRSHANAFTAYTNLTHEAFTTDLSGSVLGGAAPLTLTPGVYRFDTAAELTGSLILDTQGDPNAVFHFIIGTTLTTDANSQVTFLNGSSTNVFWAIGTSATLGVGSTLQGNLIATTSVTVNGGVTVNGRVLAIDGAVTMDTNVINGAAPASATASHWTGNTSNTWSGGNWSPDANGEITGRSLAPVADVIFSATGATQQNTVLDFNAAVSSLTVNDPAAVTISGSNVLTIMGTASTSGITIENGAGLTTINTDLVLKGTSETMAVNNAAGLQINGTISGAIGLTKTGPGTLTLSATNTYTGTTTINGGTLKADATGALGTTSSIVVNSGGTLLLSQSGSATTDRINDNSTLALDGGTFNTGGLSERNLAGGVVTPGIGAVTLLSSSIIDMGNGASVLAFANSSAQVWTGTLTILNWSGTALTGGGTDQLFFGTDSSGLTDTQLAQIAFYSDAGDTFLGTARYVGEGGEIAVPEASTWVAGLLAFGVLAFTQRRSLLKLLFPAARQPLS